MSAEIGSLLFIKDTNDATKKRPFMCIYVYRNKAGIPYDWLVIPISSKSVVNEDYLVTIEHPKLNKVSYAKLNNINSISWSKEIEVAKLKFDNKYVRDVQERIIFLLKGETDAKY
jgi:hypothetical protein